MAEFNSLTQTYTVDLASNNNFLFIPTVQGDGYASRYVIINLANNGQPYRIYPDEVRVIIQGKKADGTQIFDYCEVMEDAVSIKVNITPQMTIAAGKNKYEIAIVSQSMNTVLTSFPFYIMSSERAFDAEQATSSDDYRILLNTIYDTEELIHEVEDAEAIRASQEKTRQSNETTRKSNENTRISKENARKSAETARVNAESTRATAEERRVSAENSRAEAEAARAENEIDRIKAETARKNEWTNTLKPNVLKAIGNANTTAETIAAQAKNGDFSATISSVTAVTGAAGTLAKVENIGTAQNAQFIITIPKGDTGAPFSISKTYSSVSEMKTNFDTDGLDIGDLVVIETGDVENPDNAKVYMKSESEYVFLVDLSGSQGIKGETGQAAGFGVPSATVDANVGVPSVVVSATGEDTAKVFHFEFKNLKGEKGDTGEVSSATPIAFTQASTRSNIVSGEAINILFSKIAKYFTDLKNVAFSGSYSDLSNKPTSLKNPNALTFTGGSTVSYDGSSAKSVVIPTTLKNPSALSFTGSSTATYDGSRAVSVAIPTVPTSLKNPNALTFTGAVSATYDGSTAKTVNIPSASVGGWTMTSIGTATSGTCEFTISAAKHDFIYLDIIAANYPMNAFVPLGVVTNLGSYRGEYGYSATSVTYNVTSTKITFSSSNNTDQTTSIKAYYLDRAIS